MGKKGSKSSTNTPTHPGVGNTTGGRGDGDGGVSGVDACEPEPVDKVVDATVGVTARVLALATFTGATFIAFGGAFAGGFDGAFVTRGGLDVTLGASGRGFGFGAIVCNTKWEEHDAQTHTKVMQNLTQKMATDRDNNAWLVRGTWCGKVVR